MPYKMIIVDDESEICTGLANYFPWAELGYEIIGVFEDSPTAVAYLRENKVDVVLTDIKMPEITGIDLAKIVFEEHPGTMVIFLSGYADFSYAKKAMEYGVKFYIIKPTVYQELVDVFTKVKAELDKKNPAVDPPQQDGNTYYMQHIEKVREYVRQNCAGVTLESAAALVGMNPYYLSSFFKQHTGEKFMDYVNRVKMKKAADLLRDPAYRIFEVSLELGYKNPNNFGRAFKAYYKVSPREYRQNGFVTFEDKGQ